MPRYEYLYGQTLSQLEALCNRLEMPRFAAKQIARWLYDKHATTIEAMSDLSVRHRALLAETYEVGFTSPEKVSISADGTKKYLYRTSQNHFIESAYIPDGDRATLCISSQAGCRMGCRFCATGRQGLQHSLSTNEILNQIGSLPEEALRHGFVDSLVYEDYMQEVFASYGIESGSRGEYEFITLGDYATQLRADLKNVSSSQVAIVYADGAIVDGDGTGKDVYGNTLAEKLARVRRNDKVRAVVLRVNSPGGSALASDVIWREMELLRAEKPVIVSMGAYAASGGYYISCPADVIVADRMTLTGSIGVYGMYLDAGAALKDKLGITFDGVRSNTSADMGFMRPLSPVERSVIMRGVDKVYTTFTRNVAAGRNLPLAKVLEIAQGRVWSGEDALGIGLIDTYGGLYAAIAIAADKAELGDDYRVTEVFDEPMDLPLLFQFFGAQLRSSFTRSELGDAMQTYEQIQEAVSQQGVVMYCPYRMDLEEQ